MCIRDSASSGRVRAEVYIDTGDKLRNEAIFDELKAQREAIEAAYGSTLEWEKLEAKRACRIAIYIDGDIDVDSEKLAEIKKWVVANLLRMKQVLPQSTELKPSRVE
jgi:hypothetical protein